MSAADAARAGQAAAEALMVDTFVPYMPAEAALTGGLKQPTFTRATATPGKLKDPTELTVDRADVQRQALRARLDLPVTQTPKVGWEFLCTAIGDGTDPSLLGRRWRVVAVPLAKTFVTARRVDVEEVPA